MLATETIPVPYGFYADVVPRGARKSRSAKVAAAHPIAVKLGYLDSSEAPILMVVSEPTWDTGGPTPSLETLVQRTLVRYYDHRYWRLAHSPNFPDALLTYPEFKTLLGEQGNASPWIKHEPPGLAQASLRHLEPSPEAAKVRDRIRDFASHYVMIDGLFYRACHPPQYQVSTYGLGRNHGGTALRINWDKSVGPPSPFLFAADQFEAALTKATKVASDRGDTNSLPIQPHGEIQLLAPLPGPRPPRSAPGPPVRSAREL